LFTNKSLAGDDQTIKVPFYRICELEPSIPLAAWTGEGDEKKGDRMANNTTKSQDMDPDLCAEPSYIIRQGIC
jgi:hypothetical protein